MNSYCVLSEVFCFLVWGEEGQRDSRGKGGTDRSHCVAKEQVEAAVFQKGTLDPASQTQQFSDDHIYSSCPAFKGVPKEAI